MSQEWVRETVGDCLQPVRLPRGGKLQTRDYKDEGRYPIVDQGQEFIAGWTDREEGLIQEQLPVIVFGDHSRTFKYVDFPFVRGADGTQIMKPRPGIDPLYFYYACRSVDLPSRGYNRHYSSLKEQTVPVAPAAQQRQIAQVLRRVERFIGQQGDQLATTRALKSATLHVLFSRGLRNGAAVQHELGTFPEGWATIAIGDLGRVVTGTTPPTRDLRNYSGGFIPFVAPGDFGHADRITRTEKALSEQGLALSRPLPIDTSCFVCIGSTIGKVGLTTAPVSATNQQINAVIASERYDPRYVFHLLTRWSDHVRRHASPSPVPILSKGAFEQINVVTTTDLSEQREIAEILDAIDVRIALLAQKVTFGERLLAIMNHRLLHREIQIEDLDMSVLYEGQGDSA